MPKKETPLEQKIGARLYYELGLAITQWAQVQNSLGNVFSSLIELEDPVLTSVIFYAPTSDKVRADMVDNAAKIVLWNLPLLEEWEKLRKKIGDKEKKRGQLAHLMALHDIDPNKSILRPHIFDATIFLKYNEKKKMPIYSVKELKEISLSFSHLSTYLEDFAQKVRKTPKHDKLRYTD